MVTKPAVVDLRTLRQYARASFELEHAGTLHFRCVFRCVSIFRVREGEGEGGNERCDTCTCAGWIAVSFVPIMSKRQRSLLYFFKVSGQSDPKQAKIVSANQECEDHGGQSSSTTTIDAANAPVVSGDDDSHGEGEEEDETGDGHLESARDCDGDEAGIVGGHSQWANLDRRPVYTEKSYPWLTMDTTGLDCAICKKVGSLGPEKNCRYETAKTMDLRLRDIICARFKKKRKEP